VKPVCIRGQGAAKLLPKVAETSEPAGAGWHGVGAIALASAGNRADNGGAEARYEQRVRDENTPC
jgi:hypothetical protein